MFDPRISLANNHHDQALDSIRDADESYDSCEPLNFDAKAKKTAKKHETYRDWSNTETTTLQFRPHQDMEEDNQSGGCSSPPLWKTSPPRSPIHPRHQPIHHYRSLSPSSRTQAIARGQRELMELVKNMPETSYELSLKDLVEYPREEETTQEECLIQEKNYDDDHDPQQAVTHQKKTVKVKRQVSSNNNKAKMARNGSIDNRGLFLKMVFPMITLRSTKKKKSSITSTNAKISPKPEASEKSSKSTVDREWWKRRFSASNESDSSGVTSSNSGSSGSSGSCSSGHSIRNRKRNGVLSSCCSCFRSRKDK